MPTAPLPACLTPGCRGRGIDRGRCEDCRKTTSQRGYGSAHQREAAAARPGARCARCGSTKRLQRSHRIPTTLGGSDDPANKEWLCADCHSRFGLKSSSVMA